jgi:hypothetical protein
MDYTGLIKERDGHGPSAYEIRPIPDGFTPLANPHQIGEWGCYGCFERGRDEDGPEGRMQTHSRETGHRVESCSGDGEHSYYTAGIYEDHGRTYDAWDVGL